MSDPITIRPQDREILTDILRTILPANAEVYVFGSRARGTDKRAADLDLAIDAATPLDKSSMYRLADSFEECDLPYRVDVVDLNNTSATFRGTFERDMKLFWPECARDRGRALDGRNWGLNAEG
jgi:predicted nucleotidyltransferase